METFLLTLDLPTPANPDDLLRESGMKPLPFVGRVAVGCPIWLARETPERLMRRSEGGRRGEPRRDQPVFASGVSHFGSSCADAHALEVQDEDGGCGIGGGLGTAGMAVSAPMIDGQLGTDSYGTIRWVQNQPTRYGNNLAGTSGTIGTPQNVRTGVEIAIPLASMGRNPAPRRSSWAGSSTRAATTLRPTR